MTPLTKASELARSITYHPGSRLGNREAFAFQLAEEYTPTTAADWTSLPGVSTAPTNQDDALDKLASALAPNDVQETTGTLSSAQLLAMNATPIELIEAPGAGKAIIVDEIELFLDFNSAAYDAGAGEDLVIRYDTSATAIATWDDADRIVEGTEDERDLVKPDTDLDLDDADDEGVEAAILSGEWATGDSPIKYRIRYRVVTLLT